MRRRTFLTLAVLLITASGLIRAQSTDETPLPFFQSLRVGLLFHVSGLDLTAYEGGVGIGFRQSDHMYWRVALGLSASHVSSESTSRYGLFLSSTLTSTSYGPSVFVAPLLLLYQDSPAFLFLSPCMSVAYNRSSSENSATDSLGIHRNNDTRDDFTAAAGCSLGGGVSISRRILLTAEYRLSIGYTNGSSSSTKTDYDARTLVLSSLDKNSWSVGTAAILSVLYQL